jgi:hypothetical protein
MKKADRFPSRRVLPIAQLALCLLLLWPWREFYVLQFRAAAHARWPTRFELPVFHITDSLPPVRLQKDTAPDLAELRLFAPALLNMPCAFVGLARYAAVPDGMLSDFWRSLSWPFAGIFFWWIVGRAFDALLAARSHVVAPAITWAETIGASLVTSGSASLTTAIIVDPSWRSDLIFPWRWVLVSFGLWSLLGLVTIFARLAQWRIRRQKRFEAAEVTALE